MLRSAVRLWLLAAICLLMLQSAPTWSMVQSGLAQYGDGAHVTFAQPFSEVPVVITTGQYGGAVIIGAANNSKTGFDLRIRDLNGNRLTSGVWVQWVAATYESGIQLGLATYKNGDHITFPSALPGCTILTSGQKDGIPYMIGAANNSSTGFDVLITDTNGNPGSGVWVQWLAVTPRSSWRCGVSQFSDGQRLSFPAMSSSPVIVTAGQKGGPVSIGAVSNSTTGCGLSIKNHQGQGVQQAWTQWLAVKGGVVSTAGAPVTTPPPPVAVTPPPPPPQPPTPTGPVSTENMLYLNSPHSFITTDNGSSGGGKTLASGGWSDYNKNSRYCRAYAIGAGFVFVGGSSNYWSRIGKMFDVAQGSHASAQRAASIRIRGDYSGRIMAAYLATSSVKIKAVVTDNGTEVASETVFTKQGSGNTYTNFSGTIDKTLSATLRNGHSYNVYLNLETTATAAIAGSAGVDVGENNNRVFLTSVTVSY